MTCFLREKKTGGWLLFLISHFMLMKQLNWITVILKILDFSIEVQLLSDL